MAKCRIKKLILVLKLKKKRTIASVFNSDHRFIFKQKQPKNSPINSSTKNKREDNDDKKKLTYQLSDKLKTLNIYMWWVPSHFNFSHHDHFNI